MNLNNRFIDGILRPVNDITRSYFQFKPIDFDSYCLSFDSGTKNTKHQLKICVSFVMLQQTMMY